MNKRKKEKHFFFQVCTLAMVNRRLRDDQPWRSSCLLLLLHLLSWPVVATPSCDASAAVLSSSCIILSTTTFKAAQVTVPAGVVVTVRPTNCTYPRLNFLGNLTVELSAAIQAEPGCPPPAGQRSAGGSFWSFGGQGGTCYSCRPQSPVGAGRLAKEGGVAGGAAENDTTGLTAGRGGGALLLTVAGTLQLEGLLDASGTAAVADGAGGGSGGRVDINAGAIQAGKTRGSIVAVGGAGRGQGGGGSGGAVHVNTSTPDVLDKLHISAYAGFARRFFFSLHFFFF